MNDKDKIRRDKIRKKFQNKSIIFMELFYNKTIDLSTAIKNIENIEVDYDTAIISNLIGFILVGHVPRITLYTHSIVHYNDNHRLSKSSRIFTGLKGFINNEFKLDINVLVINHLVSKFNGKYFKDFDSYIQKKLKQVQIEIVETEINETLSKEFVNIITYD